MSEPSDLDLDALERDYTTPTPSRHVGDDRVVHLIQRVREAEARIAQLEKWLDAEDRFRSSPFWQHVVRLERVREAASLVCAHAESDIPASVRAAGYYWTWVERLDAALAELEALKS
jgi:hypothetical protein